MPHVVIFSGHCHPLIPDLVSQYIESGYSVLHGVTTLPNTSVQYVQPSPHYARALLPMDIHGYEVEQDVDVVVTLPLVDSPTEVLDTATGFDLLALKGATVVEHAAKLAKTKNARLIVISSTLIYGDAHHTDARGGWTGSAIPESFRGYTSTFHTQAPLVETCRTSEAWCSVAYREMGVDSVLMRVGCVVGKHCVADGSFLSSNADIDGDTLLSITASTDIAHAIVVMSDHTLPHAESTPEHVFEQTRVYNVASSSTVLCRDIERGGGRWITQNKERGGGYIDSAFIHVDSTRLTSVIDWAPMSGLDAWNTRSVERIEEHSVEYNTADIIPTPTPTPHPVTVNEGDGPLVVLMGGAGFLGSNLVARLLRDGYRVVILDNMAAGLTSNIADQACDVVVIDVTAPLTTNTVPYAVIHAASLASPEFYYKDMAGTLRSGIQGTWSALSLMSNDTRLSVTSTSECYGDPLIHPQHVLYLGNVNTTGKRCQYDQSKRYAEVLVFAHLRRGIDVRVSRIFNTYGDWMRPDDGRVVTNFVDQALRGVPLTVYGRGLQTRSFIYVDDQVDGQMRLLHADLPSHQPLDRVFNIGNDTVEITMVELAECVVSEVERMTGRKVRVIHTHWTEVYKRGIESEAEAISMVDGDQIVVPDDEQMGRYMVVRDEYDPYDPKRRRADAGPARSILGWGGSIVPVSRGVERLLQYLLVRRMVLKGLDGVVRNYDYCSMLLRDGYSVLPEYLESKEGVEMDEREAYFVKKAHDMYHKK